MVYPERMRQNLDRLGGLIHSQRVLLALTEAGVPREEAYRLVQRNAMKVWEDGADFLEALLADKDVTKALSPEQIRAQFDLAYHTQARRHDLRPRVRDEIGPKRTVGAASLARLRVVAVAVLQAGADSLEVDIVDAVAVAIAVEDMRHVAVAVPLLRHHEIAPAIEAGSIAA